MNKDNKRRHFLGRLAGIGGLVLSGAVLIFGKKKQAGVFLSKDGKLVHMDGDAIKKSRKISKAELKDWINHEKG